MSPDNHGNQLVSIDVIRAELRQALAELELRLVDRFAAKSEHDALEKRVTEAETWVNRLKGAVAVVAFVLTVFGVYIAQHVWG